MDYLHGLNPRQKEAVEHTEGPLLIVAGAGAGKTRVITHRILNLINKGVDPRSILAITFTNKAAKEMTERVRHLLNQQPTTNYLRQDAHPDSSVVSRRLSVVSSPWMGTFHALGVHILREQHERAGLSKRFTIFDRSDSLSAIKASVKKTDLDPKSFEPSKILSAISREKGNMVTLDAFKERASGEYFPEIVAQIWEGYEAVLKSERALDFDDLLLKTALLLQRDERVREHYERLWRYVHIDEYQDTNHAQYVIARLLAGEQANIAVVGDLDQCMPANTFISTRSGTKRIADIRAGEEVLTAAGGGFVCSNKVLRVRKRRYKGEAISFTTNSGRELTTTPNHMLFTACSLASDAYYVYLMYKHSKGFRIGMVQSKRSPSKGKYALGFIVRCNQEKADRMWILKACTSKDEAHFWEFFFSSQYGIPLIVFRAAGTKLLVSQAHIDRLFSEIDTRERAEKLMRDLDISFDHPHHAPQGTTKTNTKQQRVNVRLTLFSDKRRSKRNPWGLSRVSVNTTDEAFKAKLESAGFRTRKGKRDDWRLEIARLDYAEAERIAHSIRALDLSLNLVKSARLTSNLMQFQPASHIHPTMLLPVLQNGGLIEEEVASVVRKPYEGVVYDLDVAHTHNYIANGVAVHNSIYSWRGATIKNILNFEKDYPNAKIVLLEENYRSTQTILAVANRIIEKNKMRREKTLFTKNAEGEKMGLYTAYDEADEASFIAARSKQLIEAGTPPSEIAVLFRANFQSRALEEQFLRLEVPYQVLGVRFFERKEVKDVLSYVKAAFNPESIGDLRRIINVPPRGIGKVTLLKIFSGKSAELPQGVREKLAAFKKLLAELKERLASGPLSEAIKWIVTASGLEAELKRGSADDEERLENIKELVTFSTRYDAAPTPYPPGAPLGQGSSDRPAALDKFLSDVALQSDQDELDEKKAAVRLMTVHASKGLEFEYVFISGLEEGLFPHERINETPDEGAAEEERRLFYVAVTRAKKKVFLTYAGVRTIFGARQVTVPSEFIFDIDEEFLQAENQLEGGGKIIYFE